MSRRRYRVIDIVDLLSQSLASLARYRFVGTFFAFLKLTMSLASWLLFDWCHWCAVVAVVAGGRVHALVGLWSGLAAMTLYGLLT